MSYEIQKARVSGPIGYASADGTELELPLGPCLMERIDKRHVDVIWGNEGEFCAQIAAAELRSAQERGALVMLQ